MACLSRERPANRIHDYDHHYDQHYDYDSDGRESGIGVELGATGLRLALFITGAVQLGYALMAILNLLKWHHESMSLVGAVRHVLPGRGEPLVYRDRAFQQLRRPEHPRLPRP
ncbi:hypothetical protein ACFY3G_37705 [Streptomyces phaeochromogenes]|uniref:hypothetical protein n=1 Tax=Streptomyces phaeochromogenes TaxID=1923 RepID=UPI0036CFAB2D